MRLESASDRPDLVPGACDLLTRGWPAWMWAARRTRGSATLQGLFSHWPQYQWIAHEGDIIAVINTVPLSFGGALSALPSGGWGWAIDNASEGRLLCALAVTISPERRGQGLSQVLLTRLLALRDRLGFECLVVPVRPNGCPAGVDGGSWALERRPDGLPRDPWLRTHVRVGGRVLHVCAESMHLTAPAAQWADWLGQPIGEGTHTLQGMLAPLEVRDGQGVYVEPNVWVEHRSGGHATVAS